MFKWGISVFKKPVTTVLEVNILTGCQQGVYKSLQQGVSRLLESAAWQPSRPYCYKPWIPSPT